LGGWGGGGVCFGLFFKGWGGLTLLSRGFLGFWGVFCLVFFFGKAGGGWGWGVGFVVVFRVWLRGLRGRGGCCEVGLFLVFCGWFGFVGAETGVVF